MKIDEKFKKLIFYATSALIILAVIFMVYQNLNAPTGVLGEEELKSETAKSTGAAKTEDRKLKSVEILTDPRFRSLVDTQILREYQNYSTSPGNKHPFEDPVDRLRVQIDEVQDDASE